MSPILFYLFCLFCAVVGLSVPPTNVPRHQPMSRIPVMVSNSQLKSDQPSRRYQHQHQVYNPTQYNQNLYLAASVPSSGQSQLYTYPTINSYGSGGYATGSNLYSYSVQPQMIDSGNSHTADALMFAASATNSVDQNQLKVVPTAVPVSSTVKATSNKAPSSTSSSSTTSNVPLGIVLGRPLVNYDGNVYVPVFYPISWTMGNPASSNMLSAYHGHGVTYPQYYQASASYPSYSLFNSMASASSPYLYNTHPYRMYKSVPYYSAKRDSSLYANRDEMMPSDVTPDINGNFKRSSQLFNYQRLNGLLPNQKLAESESTLAGSTMPYLNKMNDKNDKTKPKTDGDYFMMPVIKFRDPKDEYRFAIEATKEQLKAQHRFAKEVLLDESPVYSAQITQNQQDPMKTSQSLMKPSHHNHTKECNSFTRKSNSTNIDEHLRVRQQYLKSSPADLPVMTRIEIFDMPGADQYLGLSSSHTQPPTPNKEPQIVMSKPQYSMELDHQLPHFDSIRLKKKSAN